MILAEKKPKQLLLIPLEEVEHTERSGNPNRDRLGAGPDGATCGSCIHRIDRGKPYTAFDFQKQKRVQMHSHKYRCVCSEGTTREKAVKASHPSCIYYKEKEQGSD